MNRRSFLTTTAAASAASVRLVRAHSSPSWQQAEPLPIKTQEIYPAVHEGRLYVAGGIAAKLAVPYFTNNTFAYDPLVDQWQRMPDLPEARHHIGLVSHNGLLLGIGGFNGGYTHIWRMRDTVYQLGENEWVHHSTLPTPQAEGVISAHKGQIHIVTGQQPKGTANKDRSDHQESHLHWVWQGDAWTELAPIPTPRNSATGGWIDDLMVISGGRTATGNLDVTEIYDAQADRWYPAAPMPLPQAGTASVVIDQSLWVFGGEIFTPEARVFPNVWRYDLTQDRWHAMPDMQTPRHGLGAAKLGQRIYVVGGATEPGGSGTSNLNEFLDLTAL